MIAEASTFATIVGLLSAFSSGRQSQSTADVTDFIRWLMEHNHQELVSLIEKSYETSISIKALLNRQSSELNKKLGELAKTTALIASRMPDLERLAAAVVPGVELSDQAMSILTQMHEQRIEYFLVAEVIGRGPLLVPSNSQAIEYSDEQFLRDDIATLLELDLLRLRYNSSSDEMYYFTRAGAKICAGNKSGD
jgi:hypothetical protein